MWVMGDDRTVSLDSREWGPLPVSDITGRVVATGNSVPTTILRTPRTFVTNGLAAPDHRLAAYARWLAVAAIGLVALIILIIFGVIRFFIRLSRRRRTSTNASV
jgi:heme/copper-type cytochrome/quinol oxidase subunit 2